MNAHVENTRFNIRSTTAIEQPADADALKAALRTLGGGVSIITAGEGEARTGATVTSATALSVEPARMLVSLNRSSSTWPVVERYGHLGINIVGSTHEVLANQFAGRGGLRGADRYRGADWTTAVSGAPLLVDAVAAIDCVVEEAIERHSHVIVIGKVLAIRLGAGHSLLYQDGRYHALS
ncbi:flavin reductase family protein [Shinella yambaruensis]|uniref:Flavin reductase n=1 Tax=Shinella yambaruensis TaxID=415996 RepID=A0ABQ5ZGY9_9HYPH|nr:flavin reductase family protein [Shinella yambaruensis]MCJ8025118.1 flavin reductase family protein [Shinella yambaruensis]MCU7980677.1 flavin reductase family protein [Shinella yambaruensis]GLR52090.1 flavin reductase [Shinella yambaruensis]